MIFPACINLPASSHYKGMYPHGSPILWYIQDMYAERERNRATRLVEIGCIFMIYFQKMEVANN